MRSIDTLKFLNAQQQLTGGSKGGMAQLMIFAEASENILDVDAMIAQIKEARRDYLQSGQPFARHPHIHRAILTNNTDSVVLMLELKGSPEQLSNCSGRLTAFQTAVASGNLDAARLLLAAKADVNFCLRSQKGDLLRSVLRQTQEKLRKIQFKMDKVADDIDELKGRTLLSLQDQVSEKLKLARRYHGESQGPSHFSLSPSNSLYLSLSPFLCFYCLIMTYNMHRAQPAQSTRQRGEKNTNGAEGTC